MNLSLPDSEVKYHIPSQGVLYVITHTPVPRTCTCTCNMINYTLHVINYICVMHDEHV